MKYIIWDWNGTLLDDVALCIDVMNGMLRRRGPFASHPGALSGDIHLPGGELLPGGGAGP